MRKFTCTRRQTLLAHVQPATVLRVVPGVGMDDNRRRETIRLRCLCGHIQVVAIPCQVEMVDVPGGTGREAA